MQDLDPTVIASLLGISVYFTLLLAILGILLIVAQWKIYTKADEHGWASLIPFYREFVLFKITFGNGWLFLLLLIPFVNAILLIVAMHKLSKAFGHDIGFTLGLIFLSPIFMLILGFGESKYSGVPN